MPGAGNDASAATSRPSPVERLRDSGSVYLSHQMRQFARMEGLEPEHTAVRTSESNGMAENFVKTMERDYISIMPNPDALTAVNNLAEPSDIKRIASA